MLHLDQDATFAPSAGSHLTQVRELLELIFQHLDYTDLLRAQSVSHFWRDTILGTASLLALIFKRSEPSNEGDVLFEHLDDEVHEALDPNNMILYMRSHMAFAEYLQDPSPSMPHWRQRGADLHTQSAQPQHCWPGSLRRFHCTMCNSIHNPVVAERLHPLLHRILHHAPACIKGVGSRIVIILDFGRGDDSSIQVLRRVVSSISKLESVLERVTNDLDISRLQDDMLTRPFCSMLVVTDTWELVVEENASGVTVGQAVELMAKMCCRVLETSKRSVQRDGSRSLALTKMVESAELLAEVDRLLIVFGNGI